MRLTFVRGDVTLYFDLENGVWSVTAFAHGKKFIAPDITKDLKDLVYDDYNDIREVAFTLDFDLHSDSCIVGDYSMIILLHTDTEHTKKRLRAADPNYKSEVRGNFYLYTEELTNAALKKDGSAGGAPPGYFNAGASTPQ